eukprot:TRINITY_DN74822_c0_g1_i1.p1 TRINITY_DN74822_c0_g1~~TRINITY_DN74822_c0_g1_i1.p1  ORF type:complete len:298 (-),score=51.71 TRINITY_DN74822_c0_g1_i1:15-866(-)
MPALTLYRLPVSSCCSGVLIGLRYKGVPFEDAEPPGSYFDEELKQWRPGYGTAEYKKIVPMGTIPAVVCTDKNDAKFSLSESSTICEWLDERFPPPRFQPLLPPVEDGDSRARLRFIIRFYDLNIDPNIKQLFRHVDKRTYDGELYTKTKAALLSRVGQLAGFAEEFSGGKLGDSVFDGRMFSLVDCQLPLNLSLAEHLLQAISGDKLFDESSRLMRWHRSVLSNPAVSKASEELNVAADEWIRRKQSSSDTAFEEGWFRIKPEYKSTADDAPDPDQSSCSVQ